jgi:hypothetical protein
LEALVSLRTGQQLPGDALFFLHKHGLYFGMYAQTAAMQSMLAASHDAHVLTTSVSIAAVQRLKWLLADAQQEQLSPPHMQLALSAWQSLLSNADDGQADAASLEKRIAAESRVLDCCAGLQLSLAKRLRLSGLVDTLRQQATDSLRVNIFELDSQVSAT